MSSLEAHAHSRPGIPADGWHVRIAYLGFLLFVMLRPAWIYFEQAVGVLPSVNFAALLAVLLLVAFSTSTLRGWDVPIHGASWLTILLLAYGGAIALAHGPVGLLSNPLEFAQLYAMTIIYGAALVLFGLVGPRVMELLRGGKYRLITFACYCLLVSMVVAGIILHYRVNPTTIFPGIYHDPAGPLVYLAIADALAVASLWVLAIIKRFRSFVVLGLLVGLLLLATYSRIALAAFLVALCVMAWLRFGAGKSLATVTAVIGIPTGIFAYGTPTGDLSAWRMARLITDPSSDTSLEARQQHLEQGLERLSDHWMLGTFGGEILDGGGRGTYIHNILGFWDAYGILYFTVLVFLIGVTGIMMIQVVTRAREISAFPVALFVFCVISSITARSYVWPYLWLGLVAGQAYWVHTRTVHSRSRAFGEKEDSARTGSTPRCYGDPA